MSFLKRSADGRNFPNLRRWLSASASLCGFALLTGVLGCGLEAGPQPPSLQLPKPVADLSAARAGNEVSLHWTTPRETTDKLKLRTAVHLRICREEKTDECKTVANIFAAPGKPANYTDVLPERSVTGPLRAIHYEIFAINKRGRNAGASNPAPVLAGAAPAMVRALSATEVEQGVVLHWQPVAGLESGTSIELRRTLLTPAVTGKTKTAKGALPGLAPVQEPTEQVLRVALKPENKDPGAALDRSAAFNRKYRYIAIRVTIQQRGKQTLDLSSAASAPVVIATRDTFPPAAPSGLEAVPVSAAINNGKPEVDLSWSANTEPDVAQYLVFRRDLSDRNHPSARRRIAPKNSAEPIVAPAYRDMDVQAGRSYGYIVIAVDNAGNKSGPSAEVAVTVPAS